MKRDTMEKYLPEELEISYSHQLTDSESIKLVSNSTFLIKHDTHAELIDINSINEENWIRFWEKVEELGIWDLEENYQSCNLEADFHWKISMTYDERTINSYGMNIEPKTFKGNRIYSVLEELKEAVEELIEI